MNLGWQIFFDVDRVLHIFAGIMWIGLLYYFNFVQVPAFAKMEASARTNAIQNLVPRALFFFRWAALATVIFGLAYVIGLGIHLGRGYFKTAEFYNIAIGGTIGIIMASNVWFIIWPNQKKIIASAMAGKPPDPTWGRKGLLASRTNTAFSLPMLFFMVAALHLQQLWA